MVTTWWCGINTNQVLDESFEVVSGSLGLLLPANDGDHFSVIISRLLGKDHPSSKFVPNLYNGIYTCKILILIYVHVAVQYKN